MVWLPNIKRLGDNTMNYECQKTLFEKDGIITALTELCNRCSVCYRNTSGTMNCSGCLEYYAECICKQLTREEIEDSIWDDK
jgi:hypothetical protein